MAASKHIGRIGGLAIALGLGTAVFGLGQGVAAVYTPKDFGLTEIMGGIVDVIRSAHGLG